MSVPNFVAIDTEATGLYPWHGHRPFAASAAFPSGIVKHWRESWGGLEEILNDSAIDKVFFNAVFDWRMLESLGFKIRGKVWDVRIMAHLIRARMKISLDNVAKAYLPPDTQKVVDEINDWFKANKINKDARGESFIKLPPELLKKRCNIDAIITAKLFKKFWHTCATTFPFLMKQEHALIPVVKNMGDRGLLIDPEEARVQGAALEQISTEVMLFCEGILDIEPFNMNSQAHLRAVLERAGILHLIDEKTPKTRQPKLSDENLRRLHHPVSAMLCVGKMATYLRQSFIGQMMDHVDSNNVVHPGWDQCGTLSGRFSTSKPNIMNAPGEGGHLTEEEIEEQIEMTGFDLAPHIKKIFRVRPGYRHVHADKKKVEVYMAGHYSGDQVLIDLMNSGRDIHNEISLKMFGSDDKTLRVRAKQIVFGYQYSCGDPVIAKNIQGTVQEAKGYRALLNKMFPGLPRWKSELARQISARGFVLTDHGRRHYLYPGESYMTVNRMCQGTAADEVKSRMVAIYNEFVPEFPGSNIILNYHDDICTEVPLEYEEAKVRKAYQEVMEETSLDYKVPLPVSLATTTETWADLKEYEDAIN